MFIHILALLLATATTLDAYSSGAPASACATLAPKHPGIVGQSSQVSYSIQPHAQRVAQGSSLIVTVSSPQLSPYQGFVLQARNPLAPNQPLGRFINIPANAQTVDCPPTTQNTVTHTDTSTKTNLQFEWEPPADYIGAVVFHGTVLQDFTADWSDVTSDAVYVVKRSLTDNGGQSDGISRQLNMNPPPKLSPKQSVQESDARNVMTVGCGQGTKTCFGMPVGCIDTDNCVVLATVVYTGTQYVFELFAEYVFAPGFTYVAIGLSDDDKMGADSVVQCVDKSIVGRGVVIESSWNIDTLLGNQVFPITPEVELVFANVTGGHVYCQFTRQPQTTHNDLLYDLDNTKYYLLLAQGPAPGGGAIGTHLAKAASSESFLLSEGGIVVPKSKVLLRLHAAFMIAAWIGSASIGIFLARYYKQTFVGSQMCGKDQWFVWHRVCMLTTWTLTVVAFILIFVELKAWSTAKNPHAILGMCTTILAFIQPFMAVFRPDPTSDKRPIFNWFHWLVGNAAHILAIMTIFFATKLAKAEVPSWLDWIIISYVIFHVIMHLTLSILGCTSEPSSSQQVSPEVRVEKMKSNPTLYGASKGQYGSRHSLYGANAHKKEDAPNSTLRKILLGVYIVVVVLLTTAILVIAAMAPIEGSSNQK